MMGLVRACARRFRGNSGVVLQFFPVVHMPFVMLRRIPMARKFGKAILVSQVQGFSKVVQTVQVPQVQVAESTVDPSTL